MLSKGAGKYRAYLLALVLAFSVCLLPGFFTGNADAKEAYADQAFAEEAFAKEVLAQEAEEGAAPEQEFGKDVFYKDWEGNPLQGPVSGPPAPTLGPDDYNKYDFAPSRNMLLSAPVHRSSVRG